MGRKNRSNGQGRWHQPRDTLDSDNNMPRRARRRAKQMGHDFGPTFFVPSYGVRRPIVADEKMKQFHADLRESLPKNYQVVSAENIALTILERRLLIAKFRNADIQPVVGEIEEVMRATRRSLRSHLEEGIPRSMPVSLGRVARSGSSIVGPTKLAIELNGWRGFNHRYANESDRMFRGTDREIPAIPTVITEANICLGAIGNGLSQYEDTPGFNDVNPFNRTPHITIAQKQQGGPVSPTEASAMAGIVEEIMPDPEELRLFDPVIYWRYGPRSFQSEVLSVRPTRSFGPETVPALRKVA